MKIRTVILLCLVFCLKAGAAENVFPRLFETAIRKDVPPEAFVYNWRDAVLMKSFIDIWRTDESRKRQVEEYILSAMTRLAPKAHGRHPNGIAAAAGFAFLKEAGLNTAETDAALERVLEHYRQIPRSGDGGCSHRPGRVELWDDTLYMLDIFLLQCYRATGDMAWVEEFADELLSHARHLRDSRTGLWYHGWSESEKSYDDKCCQKGWNANPARRNSEFWGRGNGWVAMSLADILEVLPADDPRYPEILSMFRKMAARLARLQDRRTGMWRQLPARRGDKENFPEASCTAMFGYALAKGVACGVLPGRMLSSAKRALRGLEGNCVKEEDGRLFLDCICEGTCIGDRDYYYSRRRIAGETYATGALLMLENLLNQ